MSSYAVTTWCQMRVNTPPSKPLPSFKAPESAHLHLCQQVHREELWENGFHIPMQTVPFHFLHQQDVLCGADGLPLAFRAERLWEAPGHSGQGLYWPRHYVHPHQAAE